jgi:hypothetical protein
MSGHCKKFGLHNKKLHILYSAPSTVAANYGKRVGCDPHRNSVRPATLFGIINKTAFYKLFLSRAFSTSKLDGGEWSASRPARALPPGKGHPMSIVQEVRWAPEPVWTQRLEKTSSASVRDPTPVVQSVVRHCTD